MLGRFLQGGAMPDTRSKRISFTNARGDELRGTIDLPPEGEAYAWAVFSHCFTCNRNYKAAVYVGRNLARRGIGMLRYDFPGLGDSGGDFAETTLTNYVDDVQSAAAWLENEYEAPRALIGHSMGGSATLLAAGELDSVELVVTLAAPAHPDRLGRRLRNVREEALEKGRAELNINGRKFTIGSEFFKDIEQHDLRKAVSGLDKKLLVVHSPEDDTVPYSAAEELMEWASLPKSLLTLDQGDHLLTRDEDAERVANAIAVRLPRR